MQENQIFRYTETWKVLAAGSEGCALCTGKKAVGARPSSRHGLRIRQEVAAWAG